MSKRIPMKISSEYLREQKSPWLHTFLNRVPRELGRRYRKAVIVCPGGGYAELTEKETDMVALRFQAYGFQSFVLHYSVGGVPFPTALLEAAEAVVIVRERAAEWDIDPDGVFLCGFSAGGHLAASLAVHWKQSFVQERYGHRSCRPDGAILCYPIITARRPYGEPLFARELQAEEDSPWHPSLSVEDYVASDTPPCFLWHNADDTGVSVMNSILFVEALAMHHVPFEAHIFPTGGHALSLSDGTTASAENYIDATCAAWVPLAMDWLRRT